MKYYETAKFKSLNNKWQEKLKKDGFQEQEESMEVTDIHGVKKVGDRLKNWASNLFRGRFNSTQYEAQVTYYRLAGQFLHDHNFDSRVEKEIWEQHAKGLSMPKIDTAVGTNAGKAKRTVYKLQKVMFQKLKEENQDD
jgi:hypothetical protein